MDFSSFKLQKEALHLRENRLELVIRKDLFIKYYYNKWARK